ncbi:hypothetical protein DL771_005296 [Monosporascus sp. 5C6A]|nr:hypothetical protein DL771_005296 [Monosporascus sp. 5C6A]
MRFLQSLTTFFAGAALSGVASAVAVDTKLAARDSPFSDLGLDSDFWGAMNNYCRNGISSKRAISQLQVRAEAPPNYQTVSPGEYKSDMDAITNHGLWTDFLVSCHGVIIVGDTDNPVSKSKFLAHFYATPLLMDSLWTTLSSDVSRQDLTNMRAWLSLPDISSAPSDLDPEDMQSVEDRMKQLLQDLTGQAPTVRYHNMADASNRVGDIGTMQLNNADKTVLIDGENVPFGS